MHPDIERTLKRLSEIQEESREQARRVDVHRGHRQYREGDEIVCSCGCRWDIKEIKHDE